MSAKDRVNQKLAAAESLRLNGKFDDARKILETLNTDPDRQALGLTTAGDLPRRLQSAFMKLAKAEKDLIATAGYRFHLTPPPRLLEPYCQFSSWEKIAINRANLESVPRIIHQIWIGSNPIPSGAEAWRQHAQKHGYEYRLWLDSDLRELGIQENAAYQEMHEKGDFPGAVDVARYIILWKLGGIYLDCDWYPARQDLAFHDVMPMVGMGGMAEDIPRNTGKGGLLLANSFIMAPPAHPVFERLLKALPQVMTTLPDAPAWWATGPLLFTLMCRGGPMTLADAGMVAGSLPQETTETEVARWCEESQSNDGGLLLSWKSWVWR